MARFSDVEVSIRLSVVQSKEVGQPDDYFKTINDSYTAQYLEALGVEPSLRHRKAVARSAPLEQCEIEASWDDHSAVARSLRITQAPVGRSASSGKLPGARGAEGGGRAAEAPAVGVDKWKYMEVGPPHVRDAAEICRAFGREQGKASPQGDKGQALMHMQMHDIAASEFANGSLVDELEHMRRQARGDHSRCDEDPELVQWGEEGMREVESLKRKFILPFAAERLPPGSKKTVVVPWQSPEYREHVEIQVPKQHSAELSHPISMSLDQIMEEAVEYTENRLPLELLTTRRDPWFFAAMRERLCAPEATRLTGLLAHLLYWTVFGHLRAPAKRLPQPSQQSLILTLQELWSRLSDTSRSKKPGRHGELMAREAPSGASFVLPAFMLAIKRNVEGVFRRQYPKAFSDVQTGDELVARLLEQLNVLVMNIFDPDCVYASFGAFDSSIEAIKMYRKLNVLQMKLGLTPATKMLGREFRTTPMMLLLMNGDGGAPENPKTRMFLQKSASDVVLATVSASPPRRPSSSGGSGKDGSPASPMVLPRLDERRRQALYRTACKRIASVGLEVVSSHQGSRASSLSTTSLPQTLTSAVAAAAAAAGAAAGSAAAFGGM